MADTKNIGSHYTGICDNDYDSTHGSSVVYCVNCKENLCENCNKVLHSLGKRKLHTRKPPSNHNNNNNNPNNHGLSNSTHNSNLVSEGKKCVGHPCVETAKYHDLYCTFHYAALLLPHNPSTAETDKNSRLLAYSSPWIMNTIAQGKK